MKKIIPVICVMLLSCSSINKNKFNVGSISLNVNQGQGSSKATKGINSILDREVSLSSLLGRRISPSVGGSFFAVLIDSQRNSYIEASILRHTNTGITFHVNQSPLDKKDSFEFDITYDLSLIEEKNFQRNDDGSYKLSFKTRKNDSIATFTVNKTNNFIIHEGVLELMTGNISSSMSGNIKFIAVNDLHDVFESLTGLCFITIPNMVLLELRCKDKAKNLICPKGLTAYYEVVPANYFIARDYYCQIDCK